MNYRGKLKELKIETRAFINGRYTDAMSGELIRKKASYDGSDLPPVASCGEDDVNRAVSAAKKAYEDGVWRRNSPAEKKEIILRLADRMEEHLTELALLDTLETGRAFQNYRDDSIPKAIEAVRYFAEAVDKYYDAMISPRGSDFGLVTRVPLGVVGVITPWNDPTVVEMWKCIPALLMGNSVVLKPAEQSSLSAIRLAELTKEAGIPDGVFNVVPGYGETAGKALALHHDVRGIFFTGSSAVGKQILKYSGESNMKRVGLECGGKGPYVVTARCRRIDEAARVLAQNMFYNQGQICSAPSRVIIDRTKKEEFLGALKKYAADYVPGDPFDDANRVGCVVSEEQYEKIRGYIDYARTKGYEVFQPDDTGNHIPEAKCILPTVITGLPSDDRLAREEIFGPVVVVLNAEDMEDAIRIANDSDYGLAGAVWTDDINEAYEAADRIETGLFHINSYGNDDNSAPFGGVKESGLGKDKSMYAFNEYSDRKTIWMHFGEIESKTNKG